MKLIQLSTFYKMVKKSSIFLLFLFSFFYINQGFAVLKKNENKIPRFASLRSGTVNLHVGPGKNYPVEWVLKYRHLPVLVITEFDQWRRIKTYDETIGWVHKSLLCNKPTRVIIRDTILFERDSRKSKKVAKLHKGVVVEILKRGKLFFKVYVKNDNNAKLMGWILSTDIWVLDNCN